MAVRRSRRQSTAPKTYDPDAEAARPQFASSTASRKESVLETVYADEVVEAHPVDVAEPKKKAAPKKSAKKSPSPAPKSRSPSPAASPSPKRKSRSPSPAAPSPKKEEEQKVEEEAIEDANAEQPAWQRILLLIMIAIVVYYGASPRASA